MLSIGDVIGGKYRLLRLLGDGGMGAVYEARHEMLGTRVAVKVLHADLVRRTGLVDRFLQEARVAAQIRSPHVVHVTDVERTPEGLAYIVMELLEGEPLSALLDRQGKVPLATACGYTVQILEALEAAHALGVVHRDLKPENVFLTAFAGKPMLKLIDFGIAKLRTNAPGERSLTVAGVMMGTAEYMAPEQAYSADKVDARSDVYAVGVMLYEMLAGRRPVGGEDARVIALKVERGEVTPLVHAAPDVPREVAGLVHRAMAPRPELRFASATEMRLAIERLGLGAAPPALGPAEAVPGVVRAPTVKLPAKGATVQTGPAPSAFPPPDDASVEAQGPHTERAPGPIVFQQGSAPNPMMGVGVSGGGARASTDLPYAPPRRRRGGGGIWLLVVAPLVLGAGVVVAFIVTGDRGPAPAEVPTAPAATPTATVAPTATTPTPAATPTSGGGALEPLPPAPRAPAPRSGGGAHPTPHAPSSQPGAPSPSASATSAPPDTIPPPFALPSALPFPLMDGGGLLPFPIPSALPSAFPFPIPGFPGAAPTEAPAPSAAPSGKML